MKASDSGRESILCAAIYVDTGTDGSDCRSANYPKTGLVFAGYRHNDCHTTLDAWVLGLSKSDRALFEDIDHDQLNGKNQGFLTSSGRFVDREEGMRIARAAGQTLRTTDSLDSEDLY